MNLRVPHPRFVRMGSYALTPPTLFSSSFVPVLCVLSAFAALNPNLSSRPEARASSGPQWRDRANHPAYSSTMSEGLFNSYTLPLLNFRSLPSVLPPLFHL